MAREKQSYNTQMDLAQSLRKAWRGEKNVNVNRVGM